MEKARVHRLLGLIAFVIAVGLVTSHADAGERKPGREDLTNLENVKQNQICVHDSRPAHTRVTNTFRTNRQVDPKDIPGYNRFLDCKYWNESEVAALAKNGWRIDWPTMTLVEATAPAAPTVHKTAPVASTPGSGHWQWNPALFGSEPYKNERLAYYQDRLSELGVTDPEWHKWLSAQLIQENGEFTELRITYLEDENGVMQPCVFGLMQYNACGRQHMTAYRFWELHPEWKEWRHQLDEMAKEVAYRKELFNDELSCVILAHFHPNGSRGAKGLYASKGTCKSHRYYHTEVAQRLSLLSQ